MGKYHLEFILNTEEVTEQTLRDYMMELGEGLEVCQLPSDACAKGRNFRINIRTEDPRIVFDTCTQFGKLKSIKINEEGHPSS